MTHKSFKEILRNSFLGIPRNCKLKEEALDRTVWRTRFGKSVWTCRLTFSRLMIYIYIYICRTAPLTSRCCILYIYSTNIHTEYFKHAARSPFFSSSKCRLFHNATFFGSCIIRILNTGCAKI